MPNFKKVTEFFRAKPFADSSYLMESQKTSYLGFDKYYIPKYPIKKLLPFSEEKNPKIKQKSEWRDKEDNIERAQRRASKQINDYILMNDFTLFVTLTVSPKKTPDRTDAEFVKKQLSTWLKNQQKRNGKFQYLVVPEFHKDGKSLHFHAMFKGYDGTLLDSGVMLRGKPTFNLRSYRLGHSTAQYIDNPFKASAYIRKYITKDMPLFFGKQRYYVSKGLRKPLTVDNPQEDFLTKTPFWAKENDYGMILLIERESELPLRSEDS